MKLDVLLGSHSTRGKVIQGLHQYDHGIVVLSTQIRFYYHPLFMTMADAFNI